MLSLYGASAPVYGGSCSAQPYAQPAAMALTSSAPSAANGCGPVSPYSPARYGVSLESQAMTLSPSPPSPVKCEEAASAFRAAAAAYSAAADAYLQAAMDCEANYGIPSPENQASQMCQFQNQAVSPPRVISRQPSPPAEAVMPQTFNRQPSPPAEPFSAARSTASSAPDPKMVEYNAPAADCDAVEVPNVGVPILADSSAPPAPVDSKPAGGLQVDKRVNGAQPPKHWTNHGRAGSPTLRGRASASPARQLRWSAPAPAVQNVQAGYAVARVHPSSPMQRVRSPSPQPGFRMVF